MDKATEASIAIAKTHLFNNPNVCIKDYGSTFACICEKCRTELEAEIDKVFLSINQE